MFTEQLKIALGEFWHVAWVLVVIIAGISVLTGFVREYIPQEKFQKKLKNQNTVMGAIMGAGLGVLTPFCSASMVPVAMGMIEMAAPFSTVLPFLISAPLSNFVVVGIIIATFGWKVAIIYFIITFGGAVFSGLTVGRSKVRHQVKNLAEIAASKNQQLHGGCGGTNTECLEPKVISDCSVSSIASVRNCCETSAKAIHKNKIQGAFRFAFALFRQIVPYAILGAAISGIALAFIPSSIVERYVGNSSWYAIPVAAVIGVPLYLRIEMAIPLLSTLLTKGMGMGAAMALLIGGTGASLPELAILSSMLKPKGVLAFTLTVLVLAMIDGILFMFI